MPAWILYGIGAALVLGAANIPQKLAMGDLAQNPLSPFAYGILSGIVIITINTILLLYYKDSLQLFAKKEWGFALLAVLLFATGSVFIALGYRKGANVAQFVTLFNTNTLVATILGIILLGEAAKLSGFGILKLILGAICVIVGGVLVTL